MKNKLILWIIISFFVTLFLTGFLVYKDYGIPWDEPLQLQVASLNHRYIFQHDPALLSSLDRYYGMVFELPFLWITTHFPIPRHLLIFLTFYTGLIVFFFMAKRLFRSPGWAILACVLLAASPRLFADSFYNSKDIPLMVITAMGIWILMLAADQLRNTRGWLKPGLWMGLLSLASAAIIDTRVVGIMMIPLTFFVLAVDLIRSPGLWLKGLLTFCGYLGLTVGFVILFWPVLWQSPLAEFLNAFRKMSQYPFLNTVLYMGKAMKVADLPWHYLPVWIGITTPLIVLAGFLPGIGGWFQSLFKAWQEWRKHNSGENSPLADLDLTNWALVILWLAIPVTAIYVFHSVFYDGWRQVFFIYPAILLISILGLRTVYQVLLRFSSHKLAILFLCGLILVGGIAEPVWFMARYHPYENVYFNALAGDPATLRSRFELDYWGLSYKQAVDYVLAHDPRQNIKISMANPSGANYVDAGISVAQRTRLELVNDPSEADYFFTEFRWHPQDYSYQNEYFSIKVRGTTIMAVYRMH